VAATLLAVAFSACGSSGAPTEMVTSRWSGLAAVGSRFSAVSAAWRQPTIELTGSAIQTSYHFWVGLGGIRSWPREEIGTGSRLDKGATVCSAWYDMFPKRSVVIKMVIRPGDLMAASVARGSNGIFELTLVDRTSGHSFATEQRDPTAHLDSAEIVADWPSSKRARTAPAPARVQFMECLVDGRPIGRLSPMSIDLANELLDASPSNLGLDRASFSVALTPVGGS